MEFNKLILGILFNGIDIKYKLVKGSREHGSISLGWNGVCCR